MKTYGVLNHAPRDEEVLESGNIIPRTLNLGTSWKWSASHPGRLTPGERAPVTHWIGGWLGPTAALDAVELF